MRMPGGVGGTAEKYCLPIPISHECQPMDGECSIKSSTPTRVEQGSFFTFSNWLKEIEIYISNDK
tara:strand:- start:2804 stop:2998 length:195 start_codon:yes stop_codon:yes gene_type:complete